MLFFMFVSSNADLSVRYIQNHCNMVSIGKKESKTNFECYQENDIDIIETKYLTWMRASNKM